MEQTMENNCLIIQPPLCSVQTADYIHIEYTRAINAILFSIPSLYSHYVIILYAVCQLVSD